LTAFAAAPAGRRRRYSASVTEQEARAGIFDAEVAREHVHCFLRAITGVPDRGDARTFREAGEGATEHALQLPAGGGEVGRQREGDDPLLDQPRELVRHPRCAPLSGAQNLKPVALDPTLQT
jgi:hypothetical protein